jgi:lysophospholipase L1-like esterase
MVKLKDDDVVVFFGDSITRGFFGSNFINALKKLVAERANDAGFHFINAGRDGDMIDDLLLRVETDVVAEGPDWVVVLVGINDIFYDAVMLSGLAPQNPTRESSLYEHMVKPFIDNYASLIDTLAGDGTRVVICTTTGVEGDIGIGLREKLALVNDAIRSLAETKGVGLIDVHEAFRQHRERFQTAGDVPEHVLTVDGVHLSKEGARVVAEQIFEFFFSD